MAIRKITTKIAMKRKNKNLAISAAAPAIPLNPNSAAIIAMTRKVAAHLNINDLLVAPAA
jgi:hypothetical protein